MTSENTPLEQSILEMLAELTENERLELEDFIVNHCENDSFVDDDGYYPNLFRIFVTGNKPDHVV